ncbi:MAG: ankyrin repeat domain-containing protein, partial [Candidatus Babeliales bacterium]
MIKRQIVTSYCIAIYTVITFCGCGEKKDPLKDMIITGSYSQQPPANNHTQQNSIVYKLEPKYELIEALEKNDKEKVKKLLSKNMTAKEAIEAACDSDCGQPTGTLSESPAAFIDNNKEKKCIENSLLAKLIDSGVSIQAVAATNVIRMVVSSGNMPLILFLVKKGMDLKKYPGLLLDAAKSSDEETFKYILSIDSNVNHQDKYGQTALSGAV